MNKKLPLIVKGMNIEDYHDDTNFLSKSGLSEFMLCPKKYHYKYILGNRDEASHFNFGNAFHCAALEPEDFDERFICEPEKWPVKAKHPMGLTQAEQKEAFAADNADKTIISANDMIKLKGMAESFVHDPVLSELFDTEYDVEVSMFWHNETHDVYLKCRPDVVLFDMDVVIDIKTEGRSASRDSFSKAIRNYDYDVSCALTREGYKATTGRDLKAYIFAVIEKDEPYCCATYAADKEVFELGDYFLNTRLSRYADCKKRDYWPSYTTEIAMVGLPAWGKSILQYGEENE